MATDRVTSATDHPRPAPPPLSVGAHHVALPSVRAQAEAALEAEKEGASGGGGRSPAG